MITTLRQADLEGRAAIEVKPGSFEAALHFYPRVPNAQLHGTVSFFRSLGLQRIVNRYCHLNPGVDQEALVELLRYRPKFFRWAGTDLIHATSQAGERSMLVIETNSSPSGQKSMPLVDENDEQGGYRILVQRSLLPYLQAEELPEGRLAVIFDKNYTEASGYAAALADASGETVYLSPLPVGAADPPVRFTDGLLETRDAAGVWQPVRAAFRYVTQRPWNRIPIRTRSVIYNPVIACLAGGRNKLVASKAYDFLNAELEGTGLEIRTPETINDVRREEIPLWMERYGGCAVIKVPYSNAGQGVYTITSAEELRQFLSLDHPYDRFIVQSLIGNEEWSSRGPGGRLYHVGTMPDKGGYIYAFDLRMMVAAGAEHIFPVSMYARRARVPLTEKLEAGSSSWDMLGTNLSVRQDGGAWAADTDRLVLMDRRDFNRLGLGPDDLIDGFVQAALALIAIDRMARRLVNDEGRLDVPLFRSLNDDPALMNEILG